MQIARPLAFAAAIWQLPLAVAVENGFHGEYVDKCPLACTADSSEWMRPLLCATHRGTSGHTWNHPEDGIYNMTSLTMTDDWAEKQRYDQMAKHEINNILQSRSTIHVMQWLISAVDFSASADWNVKKEAIYGANPFLYHDAVNAMGQDKYPTVIMVDYLGVENSSGDEVPTLATLALGLNLAIHGSLCKADERRRELLDINGPSDLGARVVDAQWNGFIDINGTKFDDPLPDSILYTGVPTWAWLNRTSFTGTTFNSTVT